MEAKSFFAYAYKLIFLHVNSLYLGLQRIINCSDRYVVVNNVESKTWRRLARHMNLTDMQIDRIDYDYDKDGLSEKVNFIAS